MAFLIGVSLAMAVAIFGTLVGFDRERAFYATVLAVIGGLYGLFAVMGGSMHALLLESIPMAVFLLLSVLGFKLSQWFLVAGLVAHGVFDSFHGHVIANAVVPVWWPEFCGSYDVTAGVYLAWLIRRRGAR